MDLGLASRVGRRLIGGGVPNKSGHDDCDDWKSDLVRLDSLRVMGRATLRF